jgi:hypothetical protein
MDHTTDTLHTLLQSLQLLHTHTQHTHTLHTQLYQHVEDTGKIL